MCIDAGFVSEWYYVEHHLSSFIQFLSNLSVSNAVNYFAVSATMSLLGQSAVTDFSKSRNSGIPAISVVRGRYLIGLPLVACKSGSVM